MAFRGSWKSSKVVTRKAWAVLKENPYLFAFPIIGVVLAIIPLAAFGIPALYFVESDNDWVAIPFGIALMFGVQAVITFPAAGLVSAVDEEMHGRDASVGAGMSAAFARFGPLIAWSAILTVVSILINLIRGNGQGGLISNLLRGVLAAAADIMWQLITFFVLPVMMIEKASPIDAIKASSALFKKQWGNQLAGGVRIGGLALLLVVLPGALILGAGVGILLAGTTTAAIIGITTAVIGFLIIVLGGLIINAMRGIYSVALYYYAKDGEVLGGFTGDELQSSVQLKQ
ncbi:MAG TPA: DUF6159 family protein [Candidatus Nanopelagicales bacterium]|nr:DUF6159 family protein [Candidatus Nanopelagicales bacterium]